MAHMHEHLVCASYFILWVQRCTIKSVIFGKVSVEIELEVCVRVCVISSHI